MSACCYRHAPAASPIARSQGPSSEAAGTQRPVGYHQKAMFLLNSQVPHVTNSSSALEPILLPKLQINLADFPYNHYNQCVSAIHRGHQMRYRYGYPCSFSSEQTLQTQPPSHRNNPGTLPLLHHNSSRGTAELHSSHSQGVLGFTLARSISTRAGLCGYALPHTGGIHSSQSSRLTHRQNTTIKALLYQQPPHSHIV